MSERAEIAVEAGPDDKPRAVARAPVQRRPMTEMEKKRALAVGVVKMKAAFGFSYRFSRDVRHEARRADPQISEKEAAALERLCWTYRRQLAPDMVPAQEPPPAEAMRAVERVRSKDKKLADKYERALRGEW